MSFQIDRELTTFKTAKENKECYLKNVFRYFQDFNN